METLGAMVILEEVKLVVGKGWTPMEIESDSSVVIEQIKGEASLWRLRALLLTHSHNCKLSRADYMNDNSTSSKRVC